MSNSYQTTYRDNGAIGAILDEYEKAINELNLVIKDVSSQQLEAIVDHETKDKDCRSIQTILTHVVRAGYGYATYILKSQGEKVTFHKPSHLPTAELYIEALKEMFLFNEKLFDDYPNIILEENEREKQMHVSWDQHYNVEQLMEHAIVHILRHRRQIERFILKLK